MTRTLIVIAAFLTLSVPAALAVPPADKGKPEKPGKSQSAPGQSAEKNAAKECKAERGTTARASPRSRTQYGTNANKANAFGKCVSRQGEEGQEGRRGRGAAREGRGERCQEVQGGARNHGAEHRGVQGEVRHEREQGERLRQVRLEAREEADVVS